MASVVRWWLEQQTPADAGPAAACKTKQLLLLHKQINSFSRPVPAAAVLAHACGSRRGVARECVVLCRKKRANPTPTHTPPLHRKEKRWMFVSGSPVSRFSFSCLHARERQKKKPLRERRFSSPTSITSNLQLPDMNWKKEGGTKHCITNTAVQPRQSTKTAKTNKLAQATHTPKKKKTCSTNTQRLPVHLPLLTRGSGKASTCTLQTCKKAPHRLTTTPKNTVEKRATHHPFLHSQRNATIQNPLPTATKNHRGSKEGSGENAANLRRMHRCTVVTRLGDTSERGPPLAPDGAGAAEAGEEEPSSSWNCSRAKPRPSSIHAGACVCWASSGEEWGMDGWGWGWAG
eukprot:m.160746 g.160746  ORF g.160746 m.160746 type:complete len:346 (+) comp17056_c2_seq5:5662-6699(+)